MCDGDRQNIESVLGGHSLAEAASSIQVPCLHFPLKKWNSKRALDICKVRRLVGAPPLWGGDSALQGSPHKHQPSISRACANFTPNFLCQDILRVLLNIRKGGGQVGRGQDLSCLKTHDAAEESCVEVWNK